MFDSLAMAIAFVVYAWPRLHYGRCLNAISEHLGGTLPVAASDVIVTAVNLEPSQTAAHKGALSMVPPSAVVS